MYMRISVDEEVARKKSEMKNCLDVIKSIAMMFRFIIMFDITDEKNAMKGISKVVISKFILLKK